MSLTNSRIPDRAFILAAGLGTRMRPLTDHIPKPMVSVLGLPMIDHALNALRDAGVTTCVVNTHYKAEILHQHLKHRSKPRIILSYEPELLNTGGGIFKMIDNFDTPFFILSGDSVWEDQASHNSLLDLARAWDDEKMDILMLLQPVKSMKLTHSVGDYMLDENNKATRSLNQTGDYMFTSIRINAPHIFDAAPQGAFSYLELLDEAESKGRLFGIVNKGAWHHISTPQDVEAVNASHA